MTECWMNLSPNWSSDAFFDKALHSRLNPAVKLPPASHGTDEGRRRQGVEGPYLIRSCLEIMFLIKKSRWLCALCSSLTQHPVFILCSQELLPLQWHDESGNFVLGCFLEVGVCG